MLATPGPIPHAPGWSYEVKWDGMRVLAHITAGQVRLVSRNGTDVTSWFPELRALAELGRSAVLDGEVVAFGPDGAPSFERLSQRFGVTRTQRAAALAASEPVNYVIFDLLELDGASLMGRPLRERRGALEQLALPSGPFVVPQVFDDPGALLQATLEGGLEGVIAKRWDSTYRPGVRSRAWVKHSHRTATDAVVVGWRTGSGGSVVSLAVAAVADGALVYRGTVGSGLSQASEKVLAGMLTRGGMPSAEGLPEDADRLLAEGFRWARPEVAVEVQHLGLTAAGRFRQPVLQRVRPDLRPSDLGLPGPAASEAPAQSQPVTVAVDGRTLRIAHLDKVLYPQSGTTKAEVLRYFAAVAPHLLDLAADRPVTRRRWPDGVAAQGFFEKNLPGWAPEWIRRVSLPTSAAPITFPVLSAADTAALTWLAAHSALELHTPQWRVDAAGRPLPPDRMVIDLDPGPGVGLAQCCEVALAMRELLQAAGLSSHAVLSGSKGLHLYAPLPEVARTADETTEQAKDLAVQCGRLLPGLVVVTMAKQARTGRVFIDWSQNRAAKTTLAPWSLRGSERPFAACPVSWGEVAAGDLRQLLLGEVLERLESGSVPLPW
jgi:bifunctional non-homologous end joining protein LigD